ncbi:MAG: hypothetical protein U0871_00545 [Gemmataceae bacterium]
MLARLLLTCGLLAALPTASPAAIIVGYTPGGSAIGPGNNFSGQSLLTPAGGPWNNLAFSFFSDQAATVPSAAGTLYLLTQEYLGTPAGLSAATPGFVAASTSVSAGAYLFAAGVTVQPNTPYFVYSDSQVPTNGRTTPGTYPDGIYYIAGGSGTNYGQFPAADAFFRLTGDVAAVNAVPAPAGLILAGLGLPALGLVRRVRRA